MIVNFFSPDGRYDDIYLSNFATINVRDELLRVWGVSDVNYMGQRDYSIRAWLDPQKLAACDMTAMDVASAIRSQNLDAPAGQIGQAPLVAGAQPFQMPVATLGRLIDPGVSSGRSWSRSSSCRPSPATSRFAGRDAGSATWPASRWARRTFTTNPALPEFDGHPSVGLSIYQLPGTNALDVADRVREKMEELKTRFPDGVDYDIGYDTTPFIRESIGEALFAIRRSRDAVILVGPRRPDLPPGLAGHDPADDRRAGLADRHVRRDGDDGVHAQ